MPSFYYQIRGRLSLDKRNSGMYMSNWDWPPLFSGRIDAANKAGAKKLIEEDYGRQFPLRVLTKDIDDHAFLIKITEFGPEDKDITRLFEPTECIECNRQFKIIEKYNNPDELDKGGDFCSQSCSQAARLKRTKDYQLAASGKLPAVIYLIRQISTGRCYVGQTTRPITLRWWQHLTYPTDCKFHAAIRSTPLTDWQFQALESIALPDDFPEKRRHINGRERFWILHYDCIEAGFNTVLPSLDEPEQLDEAVDVVEEPF